MKQVTLHIMLAMFVIFGGTVVANAEDGTLFDNTNGDPVLDISHLSPTLTLDAPTKITGITTFHGNGGRGTGSPGKIGIAGVGMWQAEGLTGEGGVPNARWQVAPNVELQPGTYIIIDSDPATWSRNQGSDLKGHVVITGTRLAAPASTSAASPKLLGCYRDESLRDLAGEHVSSADMTPEKCFSICGEKGFAFAGLQFSSHCFCGNEYGQYGPADNCDMPCVGNDKENCGGSWANRIYQLK